MKGEKPKFLNKLFFTFPLALSGSFLSLIAVSISPAKTNF